MTIPSWEGQFYKFLSAPREINGAHFWFDHDSRKYFVGDWLGHRKMETTPGGYRHEVLYSTFDPNEDAPSCITVFMMAVMADMTTEELALVPLLDERYYQSEMWRYSLNRTT